jgi:hypothetical protein
MSRRRLSKFSFAGNGAGRAPGDLDLPPLTQAQLADLLYQASPANLSPEAYRLAAAAREAFYLARAFPPRTISHRHMQRKLEKFDGGLVAAASLLVDDDEVAAGIIVRQLAARTGKAPGQILELLWQVDELRRAAAEAVEGHRHGPPVLDERTPFEGFVCELLWLWRGALRLEPAISNRPPVSPFCRFAFALMRTVPQNLRLHVDGVDPSDPDTWASFTQALQRADRATRGLQVDSPIARRLAWCVGSRRDG